MDVTFLLREGLLGAKESLQNLWHGMEGPQHKHTLTTKEALEEVLDSTGIATNLSTLGTFGVLTTFLANLEHPKLLCANVGHLHELQRARAVHSTMS